MGDRLDELKKRIELLQENLGEGLRQGRDKDTGFEKCPERQGTWEARLKDLAWKYIESESGALTEFLFKRASRLAHESDPFDAWDLVQATWLRAFENLEQLREIEKLRGWLARILTNVYRDSLRKNGQPIEEVDPDTIPDERPPPLEALRKKERIEYVLYLVTGQSASFTSILEDHSLAEGMPSSLQEFVRVALEEDWDRARIAERLGIELHSVDRYRQRLREYLFTFAPRLIQFFGSDGLPRQQQTVPTAEEAKNAREEVARKRKINRVTQDLRDEAQPLAILICVSFVVGNRP